MKKVKRVVKHLKIRRNMIGTSERPRLSVFRSSQHIYAQIIDDSKRLTLVAFSDIKETGTKSERAFQVGQKLAQTAVKKGIERVVFDRGGFLYHGRVAKLAEGAKVGGLKF
ncbi:50S ribosomal protein L18 [Candidatus Daviesbacteria bacterium]|nr:50S ribosomal protein L18 [Candidatus Daviesbacteria bacterium]